MTLTPYQIVVPAISLLLIAYAWSLVMRQRKTIWEGALWTLFWGAVGYLSMFPGELRYVSELTGIKRNETAVTVTAVGVLFFIVFYLVVRIEELSQRLTKIVRNDALRNADLKDQRDDR